jgi:hypothetical protein
MDASREVDYMLSDCFLAAGQGIGSRKPLEHEAARWWRQRYRRLFLTALTINGNSWSADRERLARVGYYLGQRALHHAGESESIGLSAAMKASAEIEAGCRMNARRDSGLPGSLERTAADAELAAAARRRAN